MTTGNTTLLGLALPVEGELDGTWGDVVNQSITELVDSAVAGTTTLSADTDVTLTTTVLAANQARQAIILWTASNGATTRNVTAPAQSKPYIVINAGTGSIVLRGTGPTTGVTIIAGEKCLAAWNGSDFVKVSSSVATALTGTLPVANGGTGLTTLTANNVVLGNGTSNPLFVAPGTTGNVLTSDGTTWTSATPAATGATKGQAIAFSLIFGL
jgi:phage-related tail fiber protein